MEYAFTELNFDAYAASGIGGSLRFGSLDNPFHGPVNFILSANTDIEEKFAVRLHARTLFGKTRAEP
jgi:hypothetical protein